MGLDTACKLSQMKGNHQLTDLISGVISYNKVDFRKCTEFVPLSLFFLLQESSSTDGLKEI